MGVFDEPFSFLLLATVRWASYLGALALVGASTFRYLGRDSDGGSTPAMAAVDSRLAAIGVGAASGLLLLASLKLYGQTYAIFGLDEPVTFELMRVMALDTRWGAGWMAQVLAAVGALVAFEAARRSLRGSWTAAAAASGVAAASLPLTGHAVTEHGWVSLTMALHAVHALAAALWIGTLGAIVLAPRLGLVVPGPRIVNAFSRLAQTSVVLLVAAGGVLSWQYLGGWGALLGSTYGRTLLLKVLLVAAVLGGGWYNLRRIVPELESGGQLGRVAQLELLVACLVLIATAVLVAMPLPVD